MASLSARRSGLALVLALALLATWLVLERNPAPRGAGAASPGRELAPSSAATRVEPARSEPFSEAAPARLAVADGAEGTALIVVVVDAQERPRGGIALELLERVGESEERMLASSTSLPDDGRARLVPARSPTPGAWLRVVCRESFVPAPSLELGAELPAAPVVLRLPSHGSLEVNLLRDGAPIGHAARVELRLLDHPGLAPRNVATRDGRARFEAVGLGLALELSAVCDESGPTEPVQVDGPVSAGELVTLSLSLGPLWPRVRLRVVDGAGNPVADEAFEGWVDYGNRAAPLSSAARSDADGWLEFRLPGEPSAQGERTLVLRSERAGEGRPIRLTIRDPLAAEGVNELGLVPWSDLDGRFTKD